MQPMNAVKSVYSSSRLWTVLIPFFGMKFAAGTAEEAAISVVPRAANPPVFRKRDFSLRLQSTFWKRLSSRPAC